MADHRHTTTRCSARRIKSAVRKVFPSAELSPGGDCYYFSSVHVRIGECFFHIFTGDLRRRLDVIVREASGFKDYTGKRNIWTKSPEESVETIHSILQQRYSPDLLAKLKM